MDPVAEIAKLQEEINQAKIDKGIFEDKIKELKKKNLDLWGTDDPKEIDKKIKEERIILEDLQKERDQKIAEIKKEFSNYDSDRD